LTMAEAKQLLSALQQHLLQHQVDTLPTGVPPARTVGPCSR
jgi:hypothetical protein